MVFLGQQGDAREAALTGALLTMRFVDRENALYIVIKPEMEKRFIKKIMGELEHKHQKFVGQIICVYSI